MILVRCTRRLLKSSPIAAATDPPTPASPLGEWYANTVSLPFPGRWVTLYVHAQTLLAVVARGRTLGTTLDGFRHRLPLLLRRLGTPEPWIDARRPELAEVVVAPTANRRILGFMNDMQRSIAFRAEDAGSFVALDLDAVEDELAEKPYGVTPRMDSPDRMMRSLVEAYP